MANFTTKPVTIRGVTYPSAKAASEALGVAVSTIYCARSDGTLDRVGLKPLRRLTRADLEPLWSRLDIPIEVVAERLGVSRTGLSSKAKSLGLPSRVSNRAKKVDDETFRAMWEANVAIREMADYLGYAQHQGVTQRARHMGLPMRQRTGGSPSGWPPSITIAQFLELQFGRRMKAASEAMRRAA